MIPQNVKAIEVASITYCYPLQIRNKFCQNLEIKQQQIARKDPFLITLYIVF